MTKRDELLQRYDDARTELDRANVVALMVRRRARLAGVPVDGEQLEALQDRRLSAERAVRQAEAACREARVTPTRVNLTPKTSRSAA